MTTLLAAAIGVLLFGVLLLVAAIRASGLQRVVRGDPLDVDWEVDEETPGLRLRLRMAGRAGPLVVTGIRLLGEPAALVAPGGPDEMESSESDEGVAWTGRVTVAERPVSMMIPLRRLGAARGQLVIDYTYASVLARMPSSAWVPVEVPARSDSSTGVFAKKRGRW